jgi:flagellar hook-length control protein FliK
VLGFSKYVVLIKNIAVRSLLEKGGENMATMLNVFPGEIKQNTILQKGNKQGVIVNKSDKQAMAGFAKMLTNETDKKEFGDEVNGKEDGAVQLMAAMAGIVVLPTANIEIVNESGNLDNTDVAPIETEIQLPNIVKEVQVDTNLVTNLKASQNQLETLFSKMSSEQELVNNANGVKLLEAQGQTVNKQANMQIDVPMPQATASSLKNSQLPNAVPAIVVDNTTMEKNNNRQSIDNKKAVINQINGGVTVQDDFSEMIGVEVKSVIPPQQAVAIADSMVTSSSRMNEAVLNVKEQTNPEGILSDKTVSNSVVFSNLLTQQVVKNDHSVTVSDIKPMQQQPISDPYHVTSQIVDQARLIEGQKNTEMIIRLKPEHLGELTFKVTVENGAVSASFHSNNVEVRNILEASLVQLKQDLANQGLKVENVGIYAGLGEFFSNGQRESQQQPEVKFQNRKVEEDFLESLESNNLAETASGGSGVDYRV